MYDMFGMEEYILRVFTNYELYLPSYVEGTECS